LAEQVTLIVIGIATVSIMIAMGTLVVNGIQIKKQSQISSANLILELLQPWRKQSFKDFLKEIADPNITQYDEVNLEEFLNQLEDIAIFWKDGTLSEVHVKEFFGTNLKTVRDDESIQNYMKKWINKNPDYYFVNLTNLIKKVEEWKI